MDRCGGSARDRMTMTRETIRCSGSEVRSVHSVSGGRGELSWTVNGARSLCLYTSHSLVLHRGSDLQGL